MLCTSSDWQQWKLVHLMIPLLKYCSDVKKKQEKEKPLL